MLSACLPPLGGGREYELLVVGVVDGEDGGGEVDGGDCKVEGQPGPQQPLELEVDAPHHQHVDEDPHQHEEDHEDHGGLEVASVPGMEKKRTQECE